MADEVPLTPFVVSSLLNDSLSVISEEERHPWRPPCHMNFDIPLMRIWDDRSGSHPDRANRMESRSHRQPLSTWGDRKRYLAIHADYACWKPTPFISFTASARELQRIADTRPAYRGVKMMTVLNPNVRLAKGLPVIAMEPEMRHYGVADPYGRSNEYYKDEFLCLWEVTESEVVGHWQWNDLVRNSCWYEKIVSPAFEKHERSFVRRTEGEALNMSTLLDALPDDTRPSFKSDSPGSYTDWDTSSEEHEVYFQDEYDSYDSCDEVEEANATDDMFKVLEGDW